MSNTICINLGFVDLGEVENILKMHSDWMKKFYSDFTMLTLQKQLNSRIQPTR